MNQVCSHKTKAGAVVQTVVLKCLVIIHSFRKAIHKLLFELNRTQCLYVHGWLLNSITPVSVPTELFASTKLLPVLY